MPHSFHQIIILLVLVPEIVAVIVGAIRYQRLELTLKLLFILVVAGFITDLVMRFFSYYKVNNLFLIGCYIPLEFILLAAIYRKALQGKTLRKVTTGLIGVFIGYTIWARLQSRHLGFDPVDRFLEGLFVVCFVLMYLYQILKYLTTKHLANTPMFWLSAGLFIYFSSDIIIFIFSNFILSSYSKQFNLQLWDIHAVLTMILYLFYTLALWIDPKN